MRVLLNFCVLLGLSIAILVAGGFGMRAFVAGKPDYQPKQAPERLLPVETVLWTRSTGRPIVSGYGVVNSRRRLQLRSEVSGRIVDLAPTMRTGGHAKAGAVLLQIDPFAYQNALDQSELQLEELRLTLSETEAQLSSEQALLPQDLEQLSLNRAELERQTALQSKGVASVSALDNAQRQVNISEQTVATRRQQITVLGERIKQRKVAVRRQQVAVRTAKSNLEKTTIRAAFTGTLAGVSVEQGQILTANESFGELIDPENLEIRFNLSQDEIAVISPAHQNTSQQNASQGINVQEPIGLSAQVIWRRGAQTVTNSAEIARLSPLIDDSNGGLELFAVLTSEHTDQPSANISQTALPKTSLPRPGTFAEVQIQGAELENVVSIPTSALSAQNGLYVVGADDILSEVVVQVYERRGGRALVSGEIAEGSRIVAARFPRLASGLKIRDVNAPPERKKARQNMPSPNHTSGREDAS